MTIYLMFVIALNAEIKHNVITYCKPKENL